jgi:hypothetical protein
MVGQRRASGNERPWVREVEPRVLFVHWPSPQSAGCLLVNRARQTRRVSEHSVPE